VATVRQPAFWNASAVERPKPEEHPVTSTMLVLEDGGGIKKLQTAAIALSHISVIVVAQA
jgi:hypothetical protein